MAIKESSKIKKTEKKSKAEKKLTLPPAAPVKIERYFEAVGRRKKAIARVRLFTKKTGIEINNRSLSDYFPIERLQKTVVAPLEKMKIADKLGAVIKVGGGGIKAQAEAIRLGISRALLKFNTDFRKRLRRIGYLTRDARMVERKKYGLKKARRAPQWQKR
ncbi:30S ribosomal protein S9 [Candidatus Wolfebacteria bacterium CG03_land_8_20_14_0_80_40_12]|uniref:Small ribosomal subunit protein uS9 n=1 Tax=Candidatus Wolfebacteria bacterium CG03_land_8_20_14_0_80_40_12 TaxID=1975069 RepID=A0A2M7B670_9BACT|nr:MAG: 30S ribosomal protein S9 [Candidatus Wolfebacteria bacterium CG03_land_8_20_14_0_80_40_12]